MNQADRDLLELAAKAYGLVVARQTMGSEWPRGLLLEGVQQPWNPLADDGDALRLAVRLHMTVRCYMGNTCAQIGVPGQKNAYADESDLADPGAATRRAITLAAAELGRAMP